METCRRLAVGVSLLLSLLSLVAIGTWAAEIASRWESELRRFEEQDRKSLPPEGGIVFVGSSSIRLWDTARWFPDDRVINRGFGGSQISDVNEFAERLVVKYRPRIIVFYAGDNDLAKGKSAEQVTHDFQTFAELVAEKLPQTHLLYLPIKPSQSRWKLWPTAQETNGRIRRILETREHFHYVDTATPLLGDDGQPRAELFRDDKLHLNEQGYEIWSGSVRDALDGIRQKPQSAVPTP